MAKTIILFTSVMLSASLFFSSIMLTAYDRKNYLAGYERYGITGRFSGLEETTDSMLFHFRGNGGLDRAFFRQDEISHLNDVRHLLQALEALQAFTLLCAVLALVCLNPHDISKMLILTCSISLGILLSCLALYLFNGFDLLFNWFHRLLFAGNYSFDPSVSNMKAILPDGFFQDMAIRVLVLYFFSAAALGATGLAIKYKNQHKIR